MSLLNVHLINECKSFLPRLSIVKEFVALGANVNPTTFCGRTPLIYACFGGHADIVHYLIDAGADVNYYDNIDRNTPLWIACDIGNERIVDLLLAHGAHVDCRSWFNRTPLEIACRRADTTIIKKLLFAGACVERAIELKLYRDCLFESACALLEGGWAPTDTLGFTRAFGFLPF